MLWPSGYFGNHSPTRLLRLCVTRLLEDLDESLTVIALNDDFAILYRTTDTTFLLQLFAESFSIFCSTNKPSNHRNGLTATAGALHTQAQSLLVGGQRFNGFRLTISVLKIEICRVDDADAFAAIDLRPLRRFVRFVRGSKSGQCFFPIFHTY